MSSLGIVNPKKRREIDGVSGSSMVYHPPASKPAPLFGAHAPAATDVRACVRGARSIGRVRRVLLTPIVSRGTVQVDLKATLCRA